MQEREEMSRCTLLALLLCLAIASGAQTKNPKRLPDFADYPVTRVFQGQHARARIVTRFQKLFQTRIRESADDDVNFAGHFVVTTWGCGTACVQFAIIDAISGHVYDPPVTSLGLRDAIAPLQYGDMVNVRPGSALLVIEGCPEEGNKCGRFYYHFDRGRFMLIHYDPDPPDSPAK